MAPCPNELLALRLDGRRLDVDEEEDVEVDG
jgi:hypothetical protein